MEIPKCGGAIQLLGCLCSHEHPVMEWMVAGEGGGNIMEGYGDRGDTVERYGRYGGREMKKYK